MTRGKGEEKGVRNLFIKRFLTPFFQPFFQSASSRTAIGSMASPQISYPLGLRWTRSGMMSRFCVPLAFISLSLMLAAHGGGTPRDLPPSMAIDVPVTICEASLTR
jgi:hypothetical protein